MADRHTRKVLVADPDPEIRALAGLHLKNAGYEVVDAEDAVLAGKRFLESRPDLVLVDGDLPFLEGLEFIQAAHGDEDAAVSHVPMILMADHESQRERAESLGVAYLLKPFSSQRLVSLVREQIGDPGPKRPEYLVVV